MKAKSALLLENYCVEPPGMASYCFSGSLLGGQILGVSGPSGCGKSTLLKSFCGLYPVKSAKSFKINGIDCLGLEAGQRPISIVWQDDVFVDHLSVLSNLLLPLAYQEAFKDWSKEEKIELARNYLERAEILDQGSKKPSTLSGGQRQRLSICQALILRPGLLLLDEAFSSLDEKLREQLRGWTVQMLEGAETSCVMISHQEEDLKEAGKKILWKADCHEYSF